MIQNFLLRQPMEKKSGLIEIYRTEKGVMIRNNNPFQISNIFKQGIKRNFMNDWDTAINPYDIDRY